MFKHGLHSGLLSEPNVSLRDQAAFMEAGSAVSAAAVTKASAVTKATVTEARMGETAMVKTAMVESVVKAAAEAKDANEPGVVETIRRVIGIGIPIRVGGRGISRGLRLHGIATRRHALQVASLVEWLGPDRNGSVRGGRASGNRRDSVRRIP
jgi:hypothetical protein